MDSSYIGKEGQPEKLYTNTILVSDKFSWWQNCIEDAFGEDYDKKSKELSGGTQITFNNKYGNKFLTCSFYPTKNKIMVQGNHDDLKHWIKLYRESTANSDCGEQGKENDKKSGNSSEPVTDKQGLPDSTDESCGTTQVENTVAKESATVTVLTDNTEGATKNIDPVTKSGIANQEDGDTSTGTPAADDSVLFHSFNESVGADIINKTVDDPLWTDIPCKGADKSPVTRRGCSNQPSFGTRRKSRDSMMISRIKNRLDALEGILSGLQGGVLKLVEAIENRRENFTSEIITGISNKFTEMLPPKVLDGDSGKHTTCPGNSELNNIKELIGKKTNEVMVGVRSIISITQDTRKDTMRSELADKIENMTEKIKILSENKSDGSLQQSMKKLEEPLARIETGLSQNSEVIQRVSERVAHQQSQHEQNTERLTQVIRSKSTHPPES